MLLALSIHVITSSRNPHVRFIRTVRATPADEDGLCIVEGRRCIETFYAHGAPLQQLYLTREHASWHVCHQIAPSQVIHATKNVLQRMSGLATSDGTLAIFDAPKDAYPTWRSGLVAVNVTNPGNLGTLIRTAAAFDHDISIVGGVSIYNQKVIQASAGTLAQARWHRTSWHTVLASRQSPLIALAPTGTKNIRTLHKGSPALVVVGNEAHGLPSAYQEACDETAVIPMPGNTESLNVAIAGSLALYQLTQPSPSSGASV